MGSVSPPPKVYGGDPRRLQGSAEGRGTPELAVFTVDRLATRSPGPGGGSGGVAAGSDGGSVLRVWTYYEQQAGRCCTPSLANETSQAGSLIVMGGRGWNPCALF
jgi:hypothetical protein